MENEHKHMQDIAIPVHQEQLHVSKRTVDTGRGIRLHKTVSEEVLRIDETLLQQEMEIEHIPCDEWIVGNDIPGNRYEGQTLVVPVLEEVLVVEKRLRLIEEIRITVKSHQHPASQKVVLRTEHIDVETFDDHAEIGRKPSTEQRHPERPTPSSRRAR